MLVPVYQGEVALSSGKMRDRSEGKHHGGSRGNPIRDLRAKGARSTLLFPRPK